MIAWLLRGTLHLVAAEDHGWLLGLLAPVRRASSARRLSQEGVAPDDADRAVGLLERVLLDEGPLSRAQLGGVLERAGIRTVGQALPHLIARAALDGVLVAGPRTSGGEPAYAATRDWLGVAPSGPLAGDARDAALGELARRYLRAHTPASDADLAAWSGLALRDARRALTLAGVREEAPERDRGGRRVPPRLLPAFDPYVLGWRDRGFAVAPEHARRVHPGGGVLRAVATADGVACGTWTLRGADATLEPFATLAPATARALDAERRDVTRFLRDS